MDKIAIIKSLNNIINNYNREELLNLKLNLEDDVKKEIAYKTNSKTRVNTISKLQKANIKNKRENINGYIPFNDMYAFTNAYYIVALKDTLGYDKSISNLDVKSILDFTLNDSIEEIELNINDIYYNYKIKNKFYNINGINFDTSMLKDVIDILGDVTVYQGTDSKNKYQIYFINKNKEKGVLLGIK